jgi:hypothetical protein
MSGKIQDQALGPSLRSARPALARHLLLGVVRARRYKMATCVSGGEGAMREQVGRLIGHLTAFWVGIAGIYGPDYIAKLFGGSANMELSLGIGVMLFFISERYLLDLEFGRFLRHINSRVKESNAKIFDSMPDALQYVIDNARRCKGIYNTRLANPDAVERLRLQELYQKHDNAIVEAVARGCDCSLVVDVVGIKSIERFRRVKTRQNFRTYQVEFGISPVLQMILLEYKDGSCDILSGWQVGGQRAEDAKTTLIKDVTGGTMWQSFLHQFREYEKRGSPIESSAID